MPLWGPRYLHQGSVSWDEVTPAWGPHSTPRNHPSVWSAGSDIV